MKSLEWVGGGIAVIVWAAFEAIAYTWPVWSWGVIVWLMIRIGRKIDRRRL